MATSTQIPYLDTARPLKWHEAFAEYLPARHRVLARQYMKWLPIALLILLFSILTLWVRQWTAFIDEALYIQVGHEYLNHWFRDGAAPTRGGVISGVPFFYPVLAASIDSIGGLWLVRTVSGVLMITTIVLITRTTINLVNYRAGVLAAAVLSLCGPMIFLGEHGTHDAPCVTLLAGAVYVGVTKRTLRSAIAVGVMLVAAVGFKYAGAAFVPAILALTLFASEGRRFKRTAIALLTVIALGTVGLMTASDEIVQAVYTTTIDRKGGSFGVIAPISQAYLFVLLRQYIGIMILLALFGAGVLAVKSWRMAGVSLILLTTAAILPVSHMMLGELSSYEKHLGWAAMFLAPLAGAGLDRISRTRLAFAPVLLVLAVLALNAETVSDRMVYWGNVQPVIKVIEKDPIPGTYLAVNATVMDYHTSHAGYDIKWLETYDFWTLGPEGEKGIVDAVKSEKFARIILRGDETGNPAQNKAQDVLLLALVSSGDYKYQRTDAGWRIFTRIGDAPSTSTTTTAGVVSETPRKTVTKKSVTSLHKGDKVTLQRPEGPTRNCIYKGSAGGEGFSLIKCGNEKINVHTYYLTPR